MWKLRRLATCGWCFIQYLNLALQQPFTTLALGTFSAGPQIMASCSAVLQDSLDNQTKHSHLWLKSQFELKPIEVKNLSVYSQHCVLLPSPARYSMNSCCSTKGQREAPQFPVIPPSHWNIPKCMVDYRQALQCRTGCTVDFNWNMNHLSPKVI